MRIAQTFFAISVLLLLAACGGGGGVGLGGGLSTSTLNSQLSYASGPTDTVAASLVDSEGIAGVIAVAPGVGTKAVLQSIKIRTSGDYQTAYVSINGGAEFPLAATVPSDSGGGGYGPNGLNANYVSLSNLPDYSMIARTVNSSGGFGYAGIATPTPDLNSDLTYSGGWTGFLTLNTASTSAATGGGSGSMSLTLDTATNDMDGIFSGTLTVTTGPITSRTATDYAISGAVDTTLDGSIFAGTMNANSGSYTGTSDLAGVFFGDAAETAAGAFGGSLSGPTGTHGFYGMFNLDHP